MTMAFWGGVIGTTVLLGAAATGGTMAVDSANKSRKTANSANLDAERTAKQQKTAEQARLTKAEADRSASKKMFREGLYFTSPGGTLGTGNRGSSRLMGK